MCKYEPIVSVIMPMKNAEVFVSEAIASVLKQSFGDFELIVVDDGSTDSSRKIAESFADNRVKVISGLQEGVANAFNLALKSAKGKYIVNCDADDLLPEDRLSWQVAWLEDNREYDAVCGTYTTMTPNGIVLSQFDCGENPQDISAELLSGQTRTSFCTFLTKKQTLIEMGGHRSYFITAYDIDLQLRMATGYKIWYEPINSYYYRLHNSSITHTQASNKRVFFEETAMMFASQRNAGNLDDLQKGSPPPPPDFDMKASSSKHQISGILISESWRLHREVEIIKAIKKGLLACAVMPFSYTNWRNILLLIYKGITSRQGE